MVESPDSATKPIQPKQGNGAEVRAQTGEVHLLGRGMGSKAATRGEQGTDWEMVVQTQIRIQTLAFCRATLRLQVRGFYK